MKILNWKDLSKEPSEKIEYQNGLSIGQKLLNYLEELNKDRVVAIGLAAPQVGINKQIFVSYYPLYSAKIWINPTYINYGFSKILSTEGCLSIPNQEITVDRYKTISVTGATEHNRSINHYSPILKGIESIIFQHEYDHLQGLTLFDKEVKL